MKKLVLFTLVLAMLISSITVFAADEITVKLDGNVIDCKDVNGNNVPPMLLDGTTYLPVRAIANALNLQVNWDDATKSVFINGISVLAKKTDNINIFINGAKFTAKDANGTVVNPILKDGTTYLPVRAIGEAFGKKVEWDGTTKTVTLTTVEEEKPAVTVINKDKIYAIINVETGKALTATDHYTLIMSNLDENASEQGFKFVPSSSDGFYNIQSVFNGQNFDVSGHSIDAGGEIITWDSTGAENQMFTLKAVEGGNLIYSLSSGLPIQPGVGMLTQANMTKAKAQLWTIKEINPPVVVKPQTGNYRTFSISGSFLADASGLFAQPANSTNNQKWKVEEISDGQYIIINLATDMALDVNGQSLNAGDPIGTWYVNNDPNQKWTMEKNSDGTYAIKSVHSGLYLTITDNNTLIQTYKNSSLKQNWTMDFTN